jgi:hypothetical protein
MYWTESALKRAPRNEPEAARSPLTVEKVTGALLLWPASAAALARRTVSALRPKTLFLRVILVPPVRDTSSPR